MQSGGVLILPHIDLQADFSIRLADLEPVVVLQGKQGVHEPYIGVYIRDGEGMGRDIQYLGQGSSQVRLRVLDPVSYCAKRTSADFSGKPSAMPRYF